MAGEFVDVGMEGRWPAIVSFGKPHEERRFRHLSREAVHGFWRNPTSDNHPSTYLEGAASSELLVRLVQAYAEPDSRILEIGCNVGRNLSHLFRSGFTRLTGIEINGDALTLLRKTFPEMAERTELHHGPVEEVIRNFADGAFDVVYTMAVLEHLHTDSAWVFGEMVRVAKTTIIAIEDEVGLTTVHFPRNYLEVFAPLGMRQVQMIRCDAIAELGPSCVARVFQKG